MPRLDEFAVMLWVASAVVNAVLMCVMAWSGSFLRWPSLLALMGLINAQSGWCAAMQVCGSDFGYFWGYYAFALLEDLAEVWLIVQMALALFGVTPRLRRMIAHAIPAVALVALCGTVPMAFADHLPAYRLAPYVASHFDVAVSLAWVATFLCLPAIARMFLIQWSGGVRHVAIGFLLESLSTLWASVFPATSSFKPMVYLAVLCFWAAAVTPRIAPRNLRLFPRLSVDCRPTWAEKGITR